MPKTSIYISQEDQLFVQGLGKNVSDGVRYCINYVRDKRELMNELKTYLRVETKGETIDGQLKNKFLRLMED